MNRPRPIPNATLAPVQPRRRFTFITQSPHARVPLSPQPQVAQPVSTALPTRTSPLASASPSPAAEESPLVAACRRYAQQYGGLGKRADADTAADTSGQGDADDQESPLVRAARKRAQEAQKSQQAQQR
ncbi:MAG: hypothetical protein ACLGHF_04180 [Alphaproteobacteria bacterium]